MGKRTAARRATATATIFLTQGKVTIVDAADFAELSKYKWCASKKHNGRKFTAVRGTQIGDKRGIVIMSRQILGLTPGDGLEADHINHDTLDNRRSNLRVVTHQQNQQNQGSRGGTSQFVGVSWDKARKKWRAQIQSNWQIISLGRFKTEQEAVDARDTFILQAGTFHSLNGAVRL